MTVYALAMVSVVLLQSGDDVSDGTATDVPGFRLFMMAYVYVSAKDTFEPVPGMPLHLPNQICNALHTLHDIDTAGKQRQGFLVSKCLHTMLSRTCLTVQPYI